MLLRRLLAWYLTPWRRYARSRGRANRMEFWTFTLVNMVIYWGLEAITTGYTFGSGGSLQSLGPFSLHTALAISTVHLLFALAVLIPNTAVTIRRLHDTGRSGWYTLLYLIPVIGTIVIFILAIIQGEQGPNRFGIPPE